MNFTENTLGIISLNVKGQFTSNKPNSVNNNRTLTQLSTAIVAESTRERALNRFNFRWRKVVSGDAARTYTYTYVLQPATRITEKQTIFRLSRVLITSVHHRSASQSRKALSLFDTLACARTCIKLHVINN